MRYQDVLTHWGRVTHICVVELGHHLLRQWLVVCSAPSHYPNQCWNIVSWTFRNKRRWNFNRNSNIFIQEIAFENAVYKMASILIRPQWVNRQVSWHQTNGCIFLKLSTDMWASFKPKGIWPIRVRIQEVDTWHWTTPFAKSNGRFFSDAKFNMIPSSNLYDFWWVNGMHAIVNFLCKIYWLFALTRSAPGF